MSQLQLPINTEFELITAEQLAWSRGRDIANADDIAEAVLMVERWNKIRKQRQQMEIV